MKKINVLIVEDELLIAETIKLYLQQRNHQVVGIAISFDEAVSLISKTKPDIVLLDIRLYGQKSGIDVAKYLLESEFNIPYVIVSSQYDEKIVKDAMYAGAAGYLTKPISKESLWATIELAVLKVKETEVNKKFIDVKVSRGVHRIYLKDILYIKSDHVYVDVICRYSRFLCRYTLGEILDKVDQTLFVQCHRSYIINTQWIQKYSSSRVWINDFEIPISAKYRSNILASQK